jgi:hypothetical protein
MACLGCWRGAALPYLGSDGVAPFLDAPEQAAFVLDQRLQVVRARCWSCASQAENKLLNKQIFGAKPQGNSDRAKPNKNLS